MLTSLSPIEHARASRLAALAVCAIAGAICLWLLVRMAWLLLPQEDEPATAAPTAAQASAPPPQSVAKWHLFGNPQNVLLAQTARAPATTLKLTLRGTLALPDAKQGIAMIEDEHGSERAYQVGEEVASGARLSEVYADRVVLSHEGASETLNLPQPEAHVPAPEANPRSVANAGNAAATSKTGAPPLFVPPQMAHGALDWNQVQKNLRMDPAKLAQQVHIEPVFVDGKISGARLSGGGDVLALMNQAGLKPTDTITAVNGTALTGLPNPQQFMDNLKNAPSLQVTVLRDGKPATLTLNLR
jgi:general secretion pathway protein C